MWDKLKTAVAEVVNANGVGAITGTNLQDVILQVIDTLGESAGFRGQAIKETVPEDPQGPIFYLATEEGIYDGFGGVFVPQGLTVIRNAVDSQGGLIWSALPLIMVEEEITPDGENLVSAKALYKAFQSMGLYDFPEFDINSAYKAGDVLRYQGMLIEMLRDVTGGQPLEEGVDYEQTSFKLYAGAQADWQQKDETKPDFIKNKPNIPTLEKGPYASMDNDGKIVMSPKIVTLSDVSTDIEDPKITGAYTKTIGRAEDAIDRINKAIMGLGPWKDETERSVARVATEINDAKGTSETLKGKITDIERETSERIPYSEIKSSEVVDWSREDQVVSPKAISQRIEAQVAGLMTGRVTMKGKWSDIVNQGDFVIEPGYQYVYDEGQGPFGIPLEKGDILLAVNRMTIPAERDNADNWYVAQSNFDYAKLEGRVNKVEAEVMAARGTENSVGERLNKQEGLLTRLSSEVAQARGANSSLGERIDTMASRTLTYRLSDNNSEIN